MVFPLKPVPIQVPVCLATAQRPHLFGRGKIAGAAALIERRFIVLIVWESRT